MIRINYKTDFKLMELLAGDAPFKYIYQVNGSGRPYEISFNGKDYKNCRKLDNGMLLLIFDHHQLSIGKLYVHRHFYLTDQDFKDGVCDLITKDDTGYLLHDGPSDPIPTIPIPVRFYQKGDKGEPFRYEDFTPGQLDELKHSEINGGNA